MKKQQKKKIESVKFSPDYIGVFKDLPNTYILVGDNEQIYLWTTKIKLMEVTKPFRFTMITRVSKENQTFREIQSVMDYYYIGGKRGRPRKKR